MPTIPCSIVIDCTGADSPVSNYSSERTDGVNFRGIGYPVYDWLNPYGGGGPYPSTFNAEGCILLCTATTQELANLCAALQSYICSNPTDQTFLNLAQTCSGACPDGIETVFTTPAGTFAAYNQETADSLAMQYACQKVGEMMLCYNASSQRPAKWPHRNPVVANLNPLACLGQTYDQYLEAYAATAPVTFTLVSGSLPPGIDLYQDDFFASFATCEIFGTATTPGTYVFVLQATDSSGRSVVKPFSITVFGITDASPLPSATVNSPYSQQLTAAGGTAPYVFSVDTAQMPPWLTCSTTGLLEGTPDAAETDTFSVTVTDANGLSCEKEFSLTAASSSGCVDWSALIWAEDAGCPIVAGASLSGLGATVSGNLTANYPNPASPCVFGTISATFFYAGPACDMMLAIDSTSSGSVAGIVSLNAGVDRCGSGSIDFQSFDNGHIDKVFQIPATAGDTFTIVVNIAAGICDFNWTSPNSAVINFTIVIT